MESLSQDAKQDVVLEAKRIILTEQIERITDVALSNVNFHGLEKCCSAFETGNGKVCKCANGLPNWNDGNFWDAIPNPGENSRIRTLPKTLREFTEQFDLVQQIKLNSPLLKYPGKIPKKETCAFPERTSTNRVKGNERNLLGKYFKRWKLRVKIEKERAKILKDTEDRKDKLDSFIKALKKRKKAEVFIRISEGSTASKAPKVEESFKKRFLAQKHVIEKQKEQLEKQNKIIEDLKLNRITKDVEESVQKTKRDLRETLKYLSPQTKAKVAIISDVKEEAEESSFNPNLDVHFGAAPRIVLEMEKRAKERAERREMIKERKRIIDEERKRVAAEIVERQRVLDEEEKRQNVEAIKEKRRLELEAEKVRQTNRKIFLEKLQIAEDFHEMKLKRNGLRAFRSALWIREVRMIEAKNIYETNLLLGNFRLWRGCVNAIVSRRNDKADLLYQGKLKIRVFAVWKSVLQDVKRSNQVADDFYELCLLRRSFKTWHINVCIIYNQYVRNAKIADKHYKSRLLIHTFFLWKTLPSVLKLERVKEERKRKWREKVMEVLPDYNPKIDDY